MRYPDFDHGGMTNVGRRQLLTGVVSGGAILATTGSATKPAEGQGCDPGFGPIAVGPDDPRYASLQTGHNHRFPGKPDRVHVAGTAQHVAEAVERAVRAGERVAVRSGGHCLEGFTTTGVKVLIDLSQMSRVYYDAARRAFAVEAGATLGQVYDALFKGWGVTIPGGSCPAVGVGGHFAGGGYGFLSRRYGLVADHIYAVEVVVVGEDGRARVVVATRDAGDPDRDLWWANTGGGGGNFGVVTRFWLRTPGAGGTDPSRLLPKAPGTMRRRTVMLPWEKITEGVFTRLLRNYGTWYEKNSSHGSPAARLWGTMIASHRSAGTLGVVVGCGADVAEGQKMMSAHLDAVLDGIDVKPAADATEAIPYLGETNWVVEPAGRSKNKCGDLRRGFTDGQIAALYRHLGDGDYDNPGALLSITGYGGRINAVPSDATATACRDAVLRVYYTAGHWASPGDDAEHMAWVRRIYRDVHAETGGVPVPGKVAAGSYINYPDTDLADPEWNTSGVPWESIYYGGNADRLRRIKRRYDPRNVFRHALSIRPAS